MSIKNHAGLRYVGNCQETTIAEFKRMAEIITRGESDETPVQFEIRIREIITT